MRKTTLLWLLAATVTVTVAFAGCPQDEICDSSMTCSGHGTCVVVGGEPVCECDDGYVRDRRQCVDPCEGISCSGHGTCVAEGVYKRCECDDGYQAVGLSCQDLHNCVDGDEDGYGVGDDCTEVDCDDTNASIHPGHVEECDTLDNDCDGQADEDVPPDNCPLQIGVCFGAQRTCTAGVWQDCRESYGELYEPGTEMSCDGLDNNCNNQVDETCACLPESQPLPCGADEGICQAGIRFCLESGDYSPCVLEQEGCTVETIDSCTVVTMPGEHEDVCDGLDNNCNGVVDEQGICGECPFNMVLISLEGAQFCVDAYEASRPDATADAPGVDTARATSRAEVLPWTDVDATEAADACDSADKHLCSALQLQLACRGTTRTAYPYGDEYTAGVCNDGSIEDGAVAPTGSFGTCTSETAVGKPVFDLCGNVAEWALQDENGVLFGGSIEHTDEAVSCNDESIEDALDEEKSPTIGFRCCR